MTAGWGPWPASAVSRARSEAFRGSRCAPSRGGARRCGHAAELEASAQPRCPQPCPQPCPDSCPDQSRPVSRSLSRPVSPPPPAATLPRHQAPSKPQERSLQPRGDPHGRRPPALPPLPLNPLLPLPPLPLNTPSNPPHCPPPVPTNLVPPGERWPHGAQSRLGARLGGGPRCSPKKNQTQQPQNPKASSPKSTAGSPRAGRGEPQPQPQPQPIAATCGETTPRAPGQRRGLLAPRGGETPCHGGG